MSRDCNELAVNSPSLTDATKAAEFEEYLEQLLQRYVSSAKGYARAINYGSPEESNKYFDLVEETFIKLKAQGRMGMETIAKLLNSTDEGVRLWSSTHLLNYPEFNSRPVLEYLQQHSSAGLVLVAEITLDQWKNGALTY